MRVGTTFLNATGDVCIKVSEGAMFDAEDNVLIEIGVTDIRYELINVELVINDYKGEDNDNR
jgi:hypothetical protein